MIRKIGKKGREWIRERAKLIKKAVLDGKIQIIDGSIKGICKDCKHWHNLTPDHDLKRSQGGEHIEENIDWICNEPPCWCHNKRDNMGDPNKKKINKSKKADWQREHKCKNCKAMTRQYLCHVCGEKSI